MAEHGLSDKHVAMIHQVLAPHGHTIACAGLFGSRATGRYRPNSDIDMVLYGPVSQSVLGALGLAFEESLLPVTVDVLAYDLITHPPLKNHIDRVMLPLFTRAELQAK